MASTLTQREIIRRFWELLDEMPYDEITVLKLCERCELSRNTFYYHFSDLQALWEQTATDWFERMSKEHGPFKDLADLVMPLARECEKHKKELRRLYHMSRYEEFRQGMDRVLKLIVRRFVTEALKDDAAAQTDRESVERFYHSLLSGVFVNWLDADMNYDLPDFLKKMLSRVCEGEWGKLPQELAAQPADPAK